MTTKRWLLNVLDNLDDKVERDIPSVLRSGERYQDYCSRKSQIERARVLVEKGPDEP